MQQVLNTLDKSITDLSIPLVFNHDRDSYWQKTWLEEGIYEYDVKSLKQNYIIDTPPATTSGNLHIYHIFSYCHTDIIARYKRMSGYNVFYPIGWADNGLPTERRVKTYLNICPSWSKPYDPNLKIIENQRALKINKPLSI